MDKLYEDYFKAGKPVIRYRHKLTWFSKLAIGLTVILFLGKAFGLVDQSWWVVFSPLWAPALLFVVIVFAVIFGAFVYYIIEALVG